MATAADINKKVRYGKKEGILSSIDGNWGLITSDGFKLGEYKLDAIEVIEDNVHNEVSDINKNCILAIDDKTLNAIIGNRSMSGFNGKIYNYKEGRAIFSNNKKYYITEKQAQDIAKLNQIEL